MQRYFQKLKTYLDNSLPRKLGGFSRVVTLRTAAADVKFKIYPTVQGYSSPNCRD
jgi:hypothetical protein